VDLTTADRWIAQHSDLYPRIMRRLAEYGLLRGERVTRARDGFLMRTNRVDALKWCVHYFGEWEPGISEAMRRILRPGGTVIDIGANVGFTSLLAAKLVGPRGRVIAFEPCAATFAELQANIALNGFGNIKAYQFAVSDTVGTATLHAFPDNDLCQSSLLPRDGATSAEAVRTINFETIARMVDLSSVDLVKIDVEGCEPQVLDGLAAHASEFRGALIAEIWESNDAQTLLAPFGLEVARIANDYAPSFYRAHGEVTLLPIGSCNQDVVAMRNLNMLRHRSHPIPSTSPAFRWSRKPNRSSRPQPALRSGR
jgi:FkbM family methyltransferase